MQIDIISLMKQAAKCETFWEIKFSFAWKNNLCVHLEYSVSGNIATVMLVIPDIISIYITLVGLQGIGENILYWLDWKE